MRVLDRRNARQTASYAAAGRDVFVLAGQTALFRASAIRDDGGECLDALLADQWEGVASLLRRGPKFAAVADFKSKRDDADGDAEPAIDGDGDASKPELDTGDDAFLTRWVQERLGLLVVVQGQDEAACLTRVAPDGCLAGQLLRWERTTIQTFLRCVAWEIHCKGNMWRRHPFVLQKMVERLARPFLTWAHVWARWRAADEMPVIA